MQFYGSTHIVRLKYEYEYVTDECSTSDSVGCPGCVGDLRNRPRAQHRRRNIGISSKSEPRAPISEMGVQGSDSDDIPFSGAEFGHAARIGARIAERRPNPRLERPEATRMTQAYMRETPSGLFWGALGHGVGGLGVWTVLIARSPRASCPRTRRCASARTSSALPSLPWRAGAPRRTRADASPFTARATPRRCSSRTPMARPWSSRTCAQGASGVVCSSGRLAHRRRRAASVHHRSGL